MSESTVDSSSAFRCSSFIITIYLALIGATVACFSALLLGQGLRSVLSVAVSRARACFWVSKACVCKLWGSGGPHPCLVSVYAIIVHLMATPLVVWWCFVVFARRSCFGFLGLDMWLFWMSWLGFLFPFLSCPNSGFVWILPVVECSFHLWFGWLSNSYSNY